MSGAKLRHIPASAGSQSPLLVPEDAALCAELRVVMFQGCHLRRLRIRAVVSENRCGYGPEQEARAAVRFEPIGKRRFGSYFTATTAPQLSKPAPVCLV